MLDRFSIYKRLILCLSISFVSHGAAVYLGLLKAPVHLEVQAPVEVSFLPVVEVSRPVAEKIIEKMPEPSRREAPRPIKEVVPKSQPEPKVVQEKKVVAEPLVVRADLVENVDEDAVEEESVLLTQTVAEATDVGFEMPEDRTLEKTSSQLLSEAVVEAVPRYSSNPLPEYPYQARQRHWEGVVWLLVDVSADGSVGDLFVEESSGYKVLDRAATRTVSRWSFEPATRAGIPVSSKARIPVRFRLEGR